MRLLFKQRFFSWFDSYDIYDEMGQVLFTVEGQPSFGHRLNILDPSGVHIATLRQVLLTFLPKFEIYIGDQLVGQISKRFTIFNSAFDVDMKGWSVEGDFMGWEYEVVDSAGRVAVRVSKEVFNWTDTYVIDVTDPGDALCALLLVLAIDAEKCSRK